MLRSTLTQCDSPVYCVVWGWDSDQLCYCSGSNVVVRSIQSSAKQVCGGLGVRGWWRCGGAFHQGGWVSDRMCHMERRVWTIIDGRREAMGVC